MWATFRDRIKNVWSWLWGRAPHHPPAVEPTPIVPAHEPAHEPEKLNGATPPPPPPLEEPDVQTGPPPQMGKVNPFEGWDFGREGVEQGGTFYFKNDILDQLADYFVIIRRMRRCDPEGYAIFSKIGATVLPEASVTASYELPPTWRNPKDRPTFAAIWLGPDDAKKDRYGRRSVPTKFITLQRVDRPPRTIETAPGTTYDVREYIDTNRLNEYPMRMAKILRKAGLAFQYHVAIDDNGEVRLLKELHTRYNVIRPCTQKRGPDGKKIHRPKDRNEMRLPYQHFGYREIVEDVYRDYLKFRKEDGRKGAPKSIEQWASTNFIITANLSISSATGIRVSVRHGDDTAVFAVDMKRSAYFFRDRDVTALATDGRRKRIFHIVRPHVRANGQVVKMHFRGIRDFTWNEYKVHVAIEDLHHPALGALNTGKLVFDEDESLPVGMLSVEEMIPKLDAMLRR